MNGIAPWLMVLCVLAPLAGAILGLSLVACRAEWGRFAARMANLGLHASSVMAAALAALLNSTSQTTACRWGTWLELTWPRPLPLDWGFQTDPSRAIWLSVAAGLAWVTATTIGRREDRPVAFSITTCFVLTTFAALLFASGLVQMLACWTALALATLALVGWSSPAGVPGIRRAILAGLPGDLLLLWAVVWSVQGGAIDTLTGAASADGLARLQAGNPALPALIGCLLVLSVLGRCGLFPGFGWHQEARGWSPGVCIVIYGVAYVPSAIALLLKCLPLLTTADTSLELMRGLGILGAALGAFVACGQADPRRRLAFLVTAQTGILLAGLGSGQCESLTLCVLHQSLLSLATFVLFAGLPNDVAARHGRAAAGCAALSLAGLLPLAGGWSHQSLVELNSQQSPRATLSAPAGHEAPLSEAVAVDPHLNSPPAAPAWGWLCGVWLAQAFSAYAAIQSIRPESRPESPPDPAPRPGQFHWPVNLAAVLLVIGGPIAWQAGFVRLPASPEAWLRLAAGQSAALVGLAAGWQASRPRPAPVRTTESLWEPLARLSRERLYVDLIQQRLLDVAMICARGITRRLDPAAIDRHWTALAVRGAAWWGTLIESLHLSRADFYVAAILLGTATLLLTLILV